MDPVLSTTCAVLGASALKELCACVEVRIGVGRNVGVGSRYGMNK